MTGRIVEAEFIGIPKFARPSARSIHSIESAHVLKPPAQTEPNAARKPGWSFYAAFVGSMLTHLIAIVMCALIAVMANGSQSSSKISAALNSESPIPIEDSPKPRKLNPQEISLADARSVAAITTRPPRDLAVKQDLRPPSRPPLLTSPADDAELLAGLAEKVGAVGGNGSGAGGDGGANAGSGFFGFKPEGGSVVFVVDASASMNRPHNSEWKTRFRRLKAELVKSVGSMTAEQQFFIIFFNHETNPMPARSMQLASVTAKQEYLKWVATQRAIGDTDPRRALSLALRLQPDTIYFLTDGSFDGQIKRELMKLRQSRTKIHTFAFTNRTGEGVMKIIARLNGGEYHYVP